MQRLSNEILVEIFSRLEVRDLLRVERVCAHWETLVDDNVWKKKRTITETDLDLHSPVLIQVDNFILLLQKLHRVDYYCFPFMEWIHNDCGIRGFCSDTILSRILQLESVMKKMFHTGQIPVHMDVLQFLEHLSINQQLKDTRVESRRWYFKSPMELDLDHTLDDCSIANCQSVIIPYLETGSGNDDTRRTLMPVLLKVNRVEELIIEKLHFSYWNGGSASLFPNFLDKFSRIRILEVEFEVCEESDAYICMSVSFEDTLFSHDEFACTLPNGHRTLKDPIDHFGNLVDGWKRSRGINGVTICGAMIGNDTSALQCDSAPQPRHLQVLHQLLQLNVTSFDIQDTLFCGKVPFFSQLPRHEIDQTVHLCLRIGGENDHGQGPLRDQMSLHEQMVVYDSEMLSVWNSVLDIMTLRRLKSLDLTVGVVSWKICSRVLPSPLRPIHLPSLESIRLCGSVSLYHVVSLLLGVRNLRRLEIVINSVEGEPMEQLTFKKDLLDVIERMTSLTTLHIIIDGMESRDSRWLEPWWLTFSAVENVNEDETPSVIAHLREEVIQALSNLVNLESLIIYFNTDKDFSLSAELSSAALRHDEQRLCSALPRLCNVQLYV